MHSLPTFVCFCEGEMVEEVVGRDKDRLTSAVVRLLDLPSSNSGGGGGGTNAISQHPLLRFRPASFKKLFKKVLHYT